MLLALGFAATNSRFMHASAFLSVPDCTAAGGGWGCYLPGILRFLSVIAIILAVILVGVVALAVKSYLKTKDDEKVDS